MFKTANQEFVSHEEVLIKQSISFYCVVGRSVDHIVEIFLSKKLNFSKKNLNW